MNILFLFDRPIIAHQGGVERVSAILATQFQSMGYRVKYLCYSNDDFSIDRQFFAPEQLFLKCSLPDMQKIEFLSDILEEHETTVIIDQGQFADICTLIKRLPHATYIVSVFHSQPFAHYRKERMLMKNYYPTSTQGKLFKCASLIFPSIARKYYIDGNRRCFKKVLQYADRLCLLSEKYIPRFTSIYGEYDQPKLVAINNPNTFISDEMPNLFKKDKLIILVGRVYNLSKNMLDFLRVWKIVSHNNHDWRAMIVGNGPDIERLKQYASNHHIGHLDFAGNQIDVKTIYRRASIFCMTSINEGWPMVIPEAMSQGCVPVVYDTFEAIHDLIANGENGFITPRFDVIAMANQLLLLIDDEGKRISMGRNAIKSIKRFNPNVIARKWIDLISTIKQ